MQPLPDTTLTDSIWIQAEPARVFTALTASADLLHWFPDKIAHIAPRIGGEVLLEWTSGMKLHSKVQSFRQDQEISYGFYGGEKEPVTFKLTAEKNGTRLELSHLIPAGELEMLLRITSNWAHLLVGLKCWVERQWEIREP